jgi:hypothetical protein
MQVAQGTCEPSSESSHGLADGHNDASRWDPGYSPSLFKLSGRFAPNAELASFDRLRMPAGCRCASPGTGGSHPLECCYRSCSPGIARFPGSFRLRAIRLELTRICRIKTDWEAGITHLQAIRPERNCKGRAAVDPQHLIGRPPDRPGGNGLRSRK